MIKLFAKKSLAIPAGETASGVAKRPQTLRIVCGRVWITLEGMPDDHWLGAGDTLDIAVGRLIVVEADKFDSRVDIQLAAAQSNSRRLSAWLGQIAQACMRHKATIDRHGYIQAAFCVWILR